jgi:hypothetical protein
LSHAIVARSYDEATALRDRLNAGSAATVRELVEGRGLSRQKIDVLRTVLDLAFSAHEHADEFRVQFRELTWSIVDADERVVRELRDKLLEFRMPQPEIPRGMLQRRFRSRQLSSISIHRT